MLNKKLHLKVIDGLSSSITMIIMDVVKDKLRKEKRRLSEESKLKEIRLHDFRHSCASLLINNEASIMIVAKFLGHTKIDETLNTYSHLFKSKMEDIINIINELY